MYYSIQYHMVTGLKAGYCWAKVKEQTGSENKELNKSYK